jgi:thioredoxin-like negative regulator of GroEL
MIRRIAALSSLAFLLAASGALAAADIVAPLSTAELKEAISSGTTTTVVFFMNPLGGPCNAQKDILLKLREARKNDFQIAYVRTDRAEDQQAFYDYGVRSLPSLVLVNKGGKIKRVFPPGIQTAETLAAALDGLKE